ATCWIDGCPLPATKCQIDHADNWSTGGLTDLELLGPACQFHNRDRYQHPDHYTRRKTGTDRWAFTYHHPGHHPGHHPSSEPGGCASEEDR
ncbi:HNH endonuclease signature motif containing protein, partial [Microbispora sp. NPDC049633]|uniref:HNH endonuclease signature motif containing protein n=1 Tax=Microbispora sp. NPDC049633 TaxID=3154355 RepID=UPI0034345F18